MVSEGCRRDVFFSEQDLEYGPPMSKLPLQTYPFGGLAQLGERGLCKPEVEGSSPLSSTISYHNASFRVVVDLFGKRSCCDCGAPPSDWGGGSLR